MRTLCNRLDTGNMGRECRNDNRAFIILITCDSIPHEIPGNPLAGAPARPVNIRALHNEGEHALLSYLA